MNINTVKPWHFTIVFDEAKARKNGYDVAELYDCVGRNVVHFNMERVDIGTWQPKDGCDEVLSQCGALSALSKEKWVMENLASLTYFEDGEEENDFFDVIRRRNPERICG